MSTQSGRLLWVITKDWLTGRLSFAPVSVVHGSLQGTQAVLVPRHLQAVKQVLLLLQGMRHLCSLVHLSLGCC
jgi:hypothetical protein